MEIVATFVLGAVLIALVNKEPKPKKRRGW